MFPDHNVIKLEIKTIKYIEKSIWKLNNKHKYPIAEQINSRKITKYFKSSYTENVKYCNL